MSTADLSLVASLKSFFAQEGFIKTYNTGTFLKLDKELNLKNVATKVRTYNKGRFYVNIFHNQIHVGFTDNVEEIKGLSDAKLFIDSSDNIYETTQDGGIFELGQIESLDDFLSYAREIGFQG